MGEFEGRTVFITGGGSGIGRATALAFARAGAQIAIIDIDATGGQKTATMIRELGGNAIFSQSDVTRAREVEQAVNATVSTYGKLDCAINNAGIFMEEGPVAQLTEARWDSVLAVNLKGVWLCMKYEIRQMLAQSNGAIVNLSSVLGLRGAAEAPAYVASKHGVIGLTKSAALAYAKNGIRINAVCPGIIATPMEQPLIDDPQRLAELLALYPMGRIGTTDEATGALLWLCSAAASYVTGAALPVDGGHMAF